MYIFTYSVMVFSLLYHLDKQVKFTSAPALNARNPNINIIPPINESGMECPGMDTTLPSSLNLPFLGPMNIQPTAATVPPNK